MPAIAAMAHRPSRLLAAALLFWAFGLAMIPTFGNPTFAAFGAVVVATAAWVGGMRAGLAAVAATNGVSIAVFMLSTRLGTLSPLTPPLGPLPIVVGEVGLAWMGSRFRRTHDALRDTEAVLQQRNAELQAAVDEVLELREILPVCAWCRKVRDEEGCWGQLEKYISEHTHTQFTHGICPPCMHQLTGEAGLDHDLTP